MKEKPVDLTLSETCSSGGSKIRKSHQENLRKQIWVEHTLPLITAACVWSAETIKPIESLSNGCILVEHRRCL